MGARENAIVDLYEGITIADEAKEPANLVDTAIQAITVHVQFAGEAFMTKHAPLLTEAGNTVRNLVDQLSKIAEELQNSIDQLQQ